MTDWQPIETAPKDGTEVLAFWLRSGCMDVVAWANEPAGEEHWYGHAGEISPPTHWMPLPNPPGSKPKTMPLGEIGPEAF